MLLLLRFQLRRFRTAGALRIHSVVLATHSVSIRESTPGARCANTSFVFADLCAALRLQQNPYVTCRIRRCISVVSVMLRSTDAIFDLH